MRALSLSLLLLPALALAQAGAITRPALPPRGVTLPPTSPALVDEAFGLNLNPASLRFVGPGQLFYLHERNQVRDYTGNGLFLGASVLGALGTGLGVQWVREPGQPSYRKTSFGLALGSEQLALGVAYNTFASDARWVDRLTSYDLGLTLRPSRHLSLAAVVQDVNAPVVEGMSLPRRWNAAVGVRPFGERWTLGADYGFLGEAWRDGRLNWTLQTRLRPGLGLGAGFSHGLGDQPNPALQLALTVDGAHTGLTYAGGGAEGSPSHVLAARLSAGRYPALRLDQGVVAVVDLDDRLTGRRSPALAALGASGGADPFIRLMRWMELAAEDPRLRGVLLKVENLPDVDWGKAEELRQAVLRLRAGGKRVMAVLYGVDDRGYFVASAADEVYALPGSSLFINGLSASVTYLGGTMEKLGVTWDVARVGEYKTAPEQLTRNDLSPAQRETIDAYLDTQTRHYETVVAQARQLSVERVRETWAHGILTASRAAALGLLNGVLYPEELNTKLEELAPHTRYEPEYAPRDERDPRWGRRRRIAVVPVLGTISGGRSREAPLGTGQIAGAETVVRALEQARRDPSVVAIVVRVDSGGGDVLASELMYRAVLEAKKVKPVIASMGNVAASGGYYASMGAHEIWASPTTLTGSIGVFYLKPALRALGERLGVNRETLVRAPKADLFNFWRPWTQEEQQSMQTWVDSAYDDFITEVAASRGLEKTQVDAVARGRVWTGEAAQAHGLVDGMGGLVDSMRAARTRAGVPEQEELDVVVLGEPRGLLDALGGSSGAIAGLLPEPSPVLPPEARALAREVGLDAPWMWEPGLKALQPFILTVR
jgi:protease IV